MFSQNKVSYRYVGLSANRESRDGSYLVWFIWYNIIIWYELLGMDPDVLEARAVLTKNHGTRSISGRTRLGEFHGPKISNFFDLDKAKL